MSTKNPRINVTFDPEELEIIHFLSHKKKISMSSFIKKIVENWIEDYEDMLLSRRAEAAEKKNKGKPLISHEELWKELGL